MEVQVETRLQRKARLAREARAKGGAEYRARMTAACRRWTEKNRERKNELKRESYHRRKKEAPEIHRASCRRAQHRYRARKNGAGGSYDATDIEILHQLQRGLCFYCQKPYAPHHVEHMIPLSRGGTNDFMNIVLSCALCNHSKNDQTAVEFLTRRRH